MNTKQYKLRKLGKKQPLPEYSFGGFLKSGLKLAGDMAVGSLDNMLSGFGAGNLIEDGAYSSKKAAAASNQISSTLNKFKNVAADIFVPGLGQAMGGLQQFNTDKTSSQLKQEQAYNNQVNGTAAVQSSGGGSFNNYASMWSMGGVVPGGQPSAELEKNEVTLGPDGTMKKFDLPPHPNNSRIPLEEGTVIFSDNPKMRMPDGQLPAEAADKLKKQKNAVQKVVDNPNATKLAIATAKRNMANIDKQLGTILQFQMSKAQVLGGNTQNADGTEIATLGSFLSSESGKSLLSNAAALAPTIYNTFKGQQPVENLNPAAFQSPLAYGALQSMRNRQVNVNPMLASNAESAAVAESNLRNSGMGAGAYRAGVTGIQNARMKANSAVLNQASVQNNAYLGEYGQMQGAIGQKMADTNLVISDLNARNQAAGRSYGAAAAGQLSQFSQIQQQMKNQKAMDAMRMEGLKSYMDMFNTRLGVNQTGPQAISTSNLKPTVFSGNQYKLAGAPNSYAPYDPTDMTQYEVQNAGR
jgi:hypothetical protein